MAPRKRSASQRSQNKKTPVRGVVAKNSAKQTPRSASKSPTAKRNMKASLTPQRRRSKRRRQAPQRYSDETYTCPPHLRGGAFDAKKFSNLAVSGMQKGLSSANEFANSDMGRMAMGSLAMTNPALAGMAQMGLGAANQYGEKAIGAVQNFVDQNPNFMQGASNFGNQAYGAYQAVSSKLSEIRNTEGDLENAIQMLSKAKNNLMRAETLP